MDPCGAKLLFITLPSVVEAGSKTGEVREVTARVALRREWTMRQPGSRTP